MKRIIKFDINKIGKAEVFTRIGIPVRILCTDAKGLQPIIGLLCEEHNEFVYRFYKEGNYCAHETGYDLVMEEEVKTISADDLTGLKVGDKVWSIIRGWGIVTSISTDKIESYPLSVMFSKFLFEYTLTGKFYTHDLYQELFRTEITFNIPKVEIWL